jgi:hypothetical protein
MKIGDKVLVWKNNWYDKIKKKGKLVEIFEIDNKPVYRIYFYNEKGRWESSCNIFTYQSETIELDIEEMRNDKLKKLGI